jgi:hypothetical protein
MAFSTVAFVCVSVVIVVMMSHHPAIVVVGFPTTSVSHPRSASLHMVRNIDLVEALIFYGGKSIFDGDDSEELRLLPGVENLMNECERDDTALLVVVEEPYAQPFLVAATTSPLQHVTIRQQQYTPPNPRDLYEAIQSVQVQPKGFGGSSGFGSKAPDPERTPLPRHCVVLCHTEDQCRAARYAGMRVLCLTDNALADAVVDDDWESICMDDIATPGSFWLNPPHPKDDEGNAVDVLSVMEWYEQDGDDGEAMNDASASKVLQSEQTDDDYLAAILADMDPL